MANGSFGLSGFPTAPTTTSTGGGENNALSAAVVPVISTLGFNAGDLIYFKQGDYGVASGTGLTGGLVLKDTTAPVFSGTTGSYLRWPGVYGGNRGGNPCAKLTNGNTVFVYYDISSPSYPTFTILDSSGAVVVAPTTISTTIYGTSLSLMGVVALVGGGFAVSYLDNQAAAQRIAYAIYTNTGSVTTAPSRDTSITVSSGAQRIAMVALPNGGFAVAVRNNGNNAQVRFYSATTALGAWTTPTGFNAASSYDATMTLLARADSSVAFTVNDATSGVLFNISTSNTTSGSGRYGAATVGNMTSVLLADNSVAVLGGTSATGLTYWNVTGTTSATWGLPVTVNSSFTNNNPVAYLTSAGNIIVWSAGDYYPQFQFCSTAGVSLSGGPYPLLAAEQPASVYVCPGFIENGSTVNVYWATVTTANDSYNPIMTSMSANSSTYALQKFASTDGGTLATSAAVSLAGYNRSNSNPNGASYFSAAAGNTSATSITGTVLVSQTVIDSTACDALSAAALPDGGCVILYKYSSAPYTVKYTAFSKAGVLQTTVTVGSGTGVDNAARIAVLSDGKICAIYYNADTTGSTTISFAIYSTSHVLLNSGALPISGTVEAPSTGGSRLASIAALPDGYFVVSYPLDAAGLAFRTYTNTGAAYSVQYSTASTAATDVNYAVCGSLDGSVAVFWKSSTTSWSSAFYRKTAGSSVYTLVSSANKPGTNVILTNRQVALSPDGGFLFSYFDTTCFARKINSAGFVLNTDLNIGSTTPGSTVGLGVTGSGMMLTYNQPSGNLYYYNTSATAAGTLALSLANNAGSSSVVIAGSYGNNAFVGILNASTYPTYSLVSAGPVTYPFLYTTSNFSVPLTVSPSTGYYLTGVATTDCAPGGTGNVQINGSISLSSSYPSTTTYQAFDFSNPTLYGVRGTIVGRNVTMQGNV